MVKNIETISNALKIVNKLKTLPSPPAVLGEALKLTADPSVSYEKVAEVVSKDPNLTSRLLRIVNSPYYGLRQKVANLQLALVILGVREFRLILISSAMVEITKFKSLKNPLLFNKIWKNSFLMASIAKQLNTHLNFGYEGEEFVVGLLGNFGSLILLSEFPDQYSQIFQKSKNIREFLENEFNEFKCSNSDIAYALFSKWELPSILPDSIWRQYPLPYTPISSAIEPNLAIIARLSRFAFEYISNRFSEPEFVEEALKNLNLQFENFIITLDKLITEKIQNLNFNDIE